MPAYRFAPAAADDLTDIWLYSHATWGERQADRYVEALHICCARLAAGAARAKPVPAIDGVKSHHCRHHHIFFIERREAIIVIAVLHERMDLMQRLRHRL